MKRITADAHSDALEYAFDNNMNICDRKNYKFISER